jgi:hypothetical protein
MKYIMIFFLLTIGLNSCKYVNEDNRRSNSYLIENQGIEVQQAFDSLQTLFEVPNSFRVMDIYSVQIDSIENYIPEIPKEVFFYYTVGNTETRYCSKFFVDQKNVKTIYHMKTKSEIEEFTLVQDKITNMTNESIETIKSTIDLLDSL